MQKRHLRLVGADRSDATPIEAARPSTVREISEAIRAGACPDDRSFDRFLPDHLRLVSDLLWTPLVVARRVAIWLDDAGVRSVVDIGSGAGKFCVAAALASRCAFTGIEQRRSFVDAARALAYLFRVDDRVQFIHGCLEPTLSEIPKADAYYLYNPFGENLFKTAERFAEHVELSFERYKRDVGLIQRFFDSAPAGTRVITYNGFGGGMPPSYEQVLVDREMPDVLRMWRKAPAVSPLPPDEAS
jgi:SAM-dependent methyltransferase